MLNIDFTLFIRLVDGATAIISALSVRLAMQKKHQGLAIGLFFSDARQTDKTYLNAVQLRISG